MRRHALAVALIVAASLPFGLPDVAGGPLCAAGAAPGTIRAGIVVDFGNLGGTNSVECITLPAGSNGYQLLAARAAQLGVPAPRTDASGNFLCGIDGRPAQSCAVDGGDPNAYWSFWRATASTSWSDANIGMSTTVKDGDIHGWRFVTAAGSSPDLAPRIRPSSAACPTPTPSPTTAPPRPPTTSPAPTPRPGGGQVPVAVQPNVQVQGATPPGAPQPGDSDTTPTTSDARSSTTSVPVTTTTTTAPESTTEVIAGTDDGIEFTRGGDDGDTAGADDGSDDDDGGSNGLLAALGVGLAAVALAFVQSRRTRLTK